MRLQEHPIPEVELVEDCVVVDLKDVDECSAAVDDVDERDGLDAGKSVSGVLDVEDLGLC